MENQAIRGLKTQLGPSTYNLADLLQSRKTQRVPKSRGRSREPSSSDSSAEKKPPRQKLRLGPTVDVKGHVAAIDAQTSNTAMSGMNDDSEGQGIPGGTNPSGRPAPAGKQGEQFCKDFLKLDQVKKGLRDDKAEKKHRKKTACHYESLAEHKFIGTTYTVNELLPKLKPTQVVGIIMSLSVLIKLVHWASIMRVSRVSSLWRNIFLRS